MFKRITSLLLALIMAVSMIPVAALAEITETGEEIAAETAAETAAAQPAETVGTEGESAVETTAAETPETETVVTEPAETLPEETEQPSAPETEPVTEPEETTVPVIIENTLGMESAEASPADSKGGTFGEGMSWTLDETTGTLTLSGEGILGSLPWTSIIGTAYPEYSDAVKHVVLEKGITGIGDGVFSEMQSILTVTLPEGLTSIGSFAFTRCKSMTLKQITPFTSLGTNAFASCSALTEVKLGEGLTEIPYNTFSASGLKKVVFPATLETVGNMAFSGCKQLKNVQFNEGLTKIGDRAFTGCNALESVSLPGTVTEYGTHIFANCEDGLKKAVLPDSMTVIPEGLFYWCIELNDVKFPANLQEICKKAFYACWKLPSLVLPKTVTKIGEEAFVNCYVKMESIVLPEGLLTIENRAFCGCDSLTGITLPKSLDYLAYGAFEGCGSLKEIKVASGNPYYSSKDGVLYTLNGRILHTFPGGKDGGSYTIPTGVEAIATKAFMSCSFDRLVFQEGLTDIAEYALASYTKAVVFPKSLKTIGPSNFYWGYLKDVYYNGYESHWEKITIGDNNTDLEEATFHYGGVMDSGSFGEGFFWEINSSGEVVITGEGRMPDFVEYDDIPWVSFRKTITGVILRPGITQIGKNTFWECTALERVILPGSLKWIGDGAFDKCTRLEKQGEVVFQGTEEDYRSIIIGKNNEPLKKAKIVFEYLSSYLDNSAIVINGSGSAFAYYIAQPHQKVQYAFNGQENVAVANADGIVRISLGTFKKAGTHSITVEVIKVGERELNPRQILTPKITVSPFTVTQSWQASLDAKVGAKLTEGAELELGVAKAKGTLASLGVTGGVGNSIKISREVSGDRLGLTVETDVSQSVGGKFESGIDAEALTADVSVASGEVGVEGAANVTFGLKFDDYTASLEQTVALGTFFLGEALTANPNTVFLKGFYHYLADNVYDSCGGTGIAGAGASVTGNAEADLGSIKIGDEKLFSVAGGQGEFTVASSRIKEGTETRKEMEYTLDGNLSVLSLKKFDGLLSWDFLGKDVTVEAKKNGSNKSIESTSLSAMASGWGSMIIGDNYVADYNRYTFAGDSLTYMLRRTKNYDAYLNGNRVVLTVDDLGDLAKEVSNGDYPIRYDNITKDQVLVTVPMDFGAGLGVGVELDLEMAYLGEIEYSTKNGYALADKINYLAESDNVDEMVEDNTISLEEMVLQWRDSLILQAKSFFKSVTGAIKNGVKGIWADVKGVADSTFDRSVSLVSAAADSIGDIFATSYSVDVRRPGADKAELEPGIQSRTDSSRYVFTKAATIGRPFVVTVTDNATGAKISDFSDEPLELTIRYAVEDLEAAGLSPQSGVVLDGGIAMYRYSDEGDYFEFVGGSNDLTAKSVTAEITRSGQYVLAVDSCAPVLSALEVSDFRQTPTITARIDDLSGMDMNKVVFRLDGSVKVDSRNISEHFDSRLGLFTYTVPENEALSEGRHTMSFTLADTTGNSETYEYSFSVDLTAPVVSDAAVSGYTNRGSAVEIRTRVSDENLTSVCALFSKRLSDGTWTAEVSGEMVDLGDDLWGLDYEGDGSSVKIRICATDIAGNQTCSQIFEAKPYVESLELSRNYLALRAGKTVQLTAEVKPEELSAGVTWHMEDGETVAAVDENGFVTAKAPGTAWVVATAADGEREILARCRIDVTDSLVLDGVKLSADSVTTEIYSTDYTQLDVLLLLPQNYAASSIDGENQSAGEPDTAISEACFTEKRLQNLFSLNIQDDRTLEIVPTEAAVSAGKLDKTYTGSVTVTVEGESYVTDPLTLTVKTSLPKLKVTVPVFNPFYTYESRKIQVTGATVTGISAAGDLPEWLALRDGELTLTEAAPRKNTSAKIDLLISTEEWKLPMLVTTAVKCSYKAPGLKLSAGSVQLSDQPGSSEGVRLQLLPKNRKESLDDLHVLGITAPRGYSIADYTDGTFVLKAEAGFAPGKIELEVVFADTDETLKMPITVKASQVRLKLDKKRIDLNGKTGDSALITVTATPNDYVLSAPGFRLIDSAGNEKLYSGELEIRHDTDGIRISTTDKTPMEAAYTLYVKAGGSKEEAIKIRIVSGSPGMRLKQSTNLDLSFADPAIITAVFQNHSGGKIEALDYTVTEIKSGTDATGFFSVHEKDGVFRLFCTAPDKVSEKGSYMLKLKLTLADGSPVENTLKLKVKRTAIKLKLSATKLTLNAAVADRVSVAVASATKGYELTKPVWKLMDQTGTQPADGKLDVAWNRGKLQISANTKTEFGATYKILVAAAENAAQTVLAVIIPAMDKSAVTGTLKIKGNLDVIRSGSVLVTPSYRNCASDTERTEKLTVVCSDNRDVTDQFEVVQNADGTYTLSIAQGAEIDLTQKYQVHLAATFGTTVIQAKPAQLKITMGSAKLTAVTEGTLFANDKHSRINLRFTAADAALNRVARVEIQDTGYSELFEVFRYSNGGFAIGFKDGKTVGSAKPITLPLSVYLEGNGTGSANATVKLKITVIQ